jgi:hypothetical protein
MVFGQIGLHCNLHMWIASFFLAIVLPIGDQKKGEGGGGGGGGGFLILQRTFLEKKRGPKLPNFQEKKPEFAIFR